MTDEAASQEITEADWDLVREAIELFEATEARQRVGGSGSDAASDHSASVSPDAIRCRRYRE